MIGMPLCEGGKALEASVGTVLAGRYRVRGTLGSGGMAVVYRAEDAVLGRTVAVKTLHSRYAEMPSFRRRFRQEARAMASLDHENIVKVYDISQDGEVPFIVAECVAGKDVGGLIAARRDGRLDEAFVRKMAEQLLSALSYAHGRGIIHRDIKPSNILVAPGTPGGTIKVADFGIARIVEEDDVDEDEPGEIVGSARYMSPEQLRGEEATPRSDLYSVGILLYHCLTGRPPFSGDVRNLAKQHVHETPPPPRRLNKKISPGMEAAILKALAKNPAHRYGSAAEMLEDIESLGEDRAPRTAFATASPSGTASRKGRGGLVLVSVLALLFVLGGGGALANGFGYVKLPSLALASGAEDAGDSSLGRAETVHTEEAPETPAPSRETAQAEPAQDARAQEGSAGGQPAQQEVAQRKPAGNVQNAAAPAAASEEGQELVEVPNLITFYDYYARQALAERGLEASFVYDYREGFDVRGVTWATEPAAGTMVPAGSEVTVFATPQDLPPLY